MAVVMQEVLGEDGVEMPRPADQHAIQATLAAEFPRLARRWRRFRCRNGRAADLYALGGEHRVEAGCELGVPVSDQEPERREPTGELPGPLGYPFAGGVGAHATEVPL